MKERSIRILLWGSTVICMAVIFMFSVQDADRSADTSDGFINSIMQIVIPKYDEMEPDEISDTVSSLSHAVRKTAHFSLYCLLGILCSASVGRYGIGQIPRAVSSLAISISYAVSDEVHQYFVPGRACRFTDILIDAAGAAIGVSMVLAASALRKHSGTARTSRDVRIS